MSGPPCVPSRIFCRWRIWLFGLVLLAFGGHCGDSGMTPDGGQQPTVALISPTAPVGLHYGEQATLLFRYRAQGQAMAGVTLSLHIDSDNTGATLSGDVIVTNDRGEASVLLTAGAAEAAFHVICSAALADDLSIDITVSKNPFGNFDALIDATQVPGNVVAVTAELVVGSSCAALPPTQKPIPALRQETASDRQAVLAFPVLLVQPYSLIGRAEDASNRLLAYACVNLPDELLRSGVQATVSVPLSLVFPSPVGTYTLNLSVTSTVLPPLLWQELGCENGLGQVLTDAILQTLPPADADLAMQISMLRTPPDESGCRGSNSKPDADLQALLTATNAGATLVPVAVDGAALQSSMALTSQLKVSAATSQDIIGTHTLSTATLSTSTHTGSYDLSTLPVPSAADLLLTQNGTALTVPQHTLTLRLPALWRQALDDLVLMPRGVMMTPQQLFASAVASAQSGAYSSCGAVELVLCNGVTLPCLGNLKGPCTTAAAAVAQDLSSALDDAAPGFDLWLSLAFTMEDPMGTLQAQTLDVGQVKGQTLLSTGLLPLGGTATGARISP